MNEFDIGADGVYRPDVTVATVVPRDGRLLLVEERVRGEIVINQPAGHLEPGESLAEAAVRETLEETAWEVDLLAFVGAYQWSLPDGGRSFLRFVFAAAPRRHHPDRVLDDGILAARWMTPSELRAAGPRLRSPLVLRAVEDFLGGRRFPLEAVARL